MLRPLILISFLSRALSSSQCPTNVSQGSVCMYGLTVGPNIGTEAPLRDFVSKISEIDFAGHELSLKRFGQRSIPSETLSCDGATFVEDEIVSATDYVSVPLITKTYLDICTDTNKIVLSATSAENCWSQCQLNAASAHNSSNFSVHWPSTLYKNGECQCIGTLVDVFNKNVDTSSQTCTPLNQCNACQVGCSSDEHCAGSLKCGSGGDAWYETNGPWGCGQALEDSGLNFCYYDMQMCSGTYREYDTDGMTLMTAESIAFEDRPIERDPIINLFDHNSGSLIKYTDVYCKDGITWGTSGSLYPTDGDYVDYNAGNKVPRNKDDDIESCKSICLRQTKLGFLMGFEYGAPVDGQSPLERTRCKCTDKYVAPSFEFTSYQCQDVATHIMNDGWSQSYTMAQLNYTMAQLNYEYYEFGEDYHLRIPKFTGISSDATFKQIGVYDGASVEHKQAEDCSTYPCDSYEASTAEWCDMSTPETSTDISELTDVNINQCLQTCRDSGARSVVIDTTQTDYGIRSDAHFKQVGHYISDSLQNQSAADCASYPCDSYSSVTVQWCEDDTPILTTEFETVDRNQCLQTCRDANAKSVVIDNEKVPKAKSSIGYTQYGQINANPVNNLPQYESKQWDVVQDFHLHDDNTPKRSTSFIQNEEDYFPTAPTATKTNQNTLTPVEICDTSSSVSTSYDSNNWKVNFREQRRDSVYKQSHGVYAWSYHASFWSSWSGFYEYTRWRCANTCSNQGYKSVTMKPRVQWNSYGPPSRWVQCVCQSYNMADCPNANKKTGFADDKIVYIEFDTSKDVKEIAEITCHCQSSTVGTCSSVKTSLEGKKEYFEFLESGYNISLPTCNCQSRTADDCTHGDIQNSVSSKIYVEFPESSYEWNYYTETYPNLFVDKVPTFPTKRELEPILEQGYEVCEYNESVPNWRLVKENHVCGDHGESLGSAGLTVQSCADKCIADPVCEFFIYGKYVNIAYDWRGLCLKQSASRASCPEGFIESEKDSGGNFKYDFYELYPAGETVSLHKSSDETCEQVCNADTRQLYWSSYKEIPSTFNAGIWSGGTCICSIHNSSVCTREFTPLSTDQYYNPNAMQYDAQTFESAGTPSCEDERYLFGARIDWRQTLKTDGWLWSMDVSGAGIRFQDVQKTRRCPRDMQPGSSKAVDGVICVHGDVTPFEDATGRTISLDQTANDFCASGDRVRVFDGRGDNPGISAAERFNYCAEACSKRLEPIDGAWTSNAVAFVYYEGVAGDALNGRCWCELSSGCSDAVDIDGLSHLHFVSFGAGDTLLTSGSGSGLPVYYFLGPDTMSVSSFGNFAAGPPSIQMEGIRSSWAFPVRYEPQGDYHLYETTGQGDGKCLYKWDGCNVCQGHCDGDHSCAGDLVCYSRGDSHVPGCTGTPAPNTNYCYDPNTPTKTYNASSYNFTGMISDKIEKCPSGLPDNYVCTNIDVNTAEIDKSAGYVIWGRHIDLQAVPYFFGILFMRLEDFSIDWFGGVSYRFQDCFFDDMYGLAPLYLSPLRNVTGIDFSKWWDVDSVPLMENVYGEVLHCPSKPFTVHPDFAILRSPAGDNVRVQGSQVTLTSPIISSFNIKNNLTGKLGDMESEENIEMPGCLDYVYYETVSISHCINRESNNVGIVDTAEDCISACWKEKSAVFNQDTGLCICESARYPSEDCVPLNRYKAFNQIAGDKICSPTEKIYKGYVFNSDECLKLCQDDLKNWPSMLLEDHTKQRGISNANQKCYCMSQRIIDGCNLVTKKWWETQYDAQIASNLFGNIIKYNVNYCRKPWGGYGLHDDNQNTPYILDEVNVKICPKCPESTVRLDCHLDFVCLGCPYINHRYECLVPNWPYFSDFQIEENVVKTDYHCVDNFFIGPKINVEGISLSEINYDFDVLTVQTLVTGNGLLECPPLEHIPDGWVCYKNHFHAFDDLLSADNFENYWSSRSAQITSEASCCEGLNMSGRYLKDLPSQQDRTFVNANWNGAHGDAYNMLLVDLSPDYKVLFLNSNKDPEGSYILVGPYVSLRNRHINGINFANKNLTGVNLDGTSAGWVGDVCPSALPDEWHCLIYEDTRFNIKHIKIVGPMSDLQYTNLEGFDFTGVSLEDANLRYVYGKLAGCPAKLPKDWGCNSEDRYLLGPGADLSGADITNIITVPRWDGMLARCPDTIQNYTCTGGIIIGYAKGKIDLQNMNVTGVDLSQIRLTKENSILKFVFGQLKKCPLELPPYYKCVDRRIIGPYANLQGVNLTLANLQGVKLNGAVLQGAFGELSHCPLKAMGYICVDNNIVGMGYLFKNNLDLTNQDVSNVDLRSEVFLNSKNINFYGVYGKVMNCYMPGDNPGLKWLCIQNRIIGPGVNVTGLNLHEESTIYDHVDFEDVHGILKECPKNNEKVLKKNGYGCFKNVFIAPGADIRNLGMYFEGVRISEVNLTNVKASGTDFSSTFLMQTYGRMLECPDSLIQTLECLNGYVFGPSNQAWYYRKPNDTYIDLSGRELYGLTLWNNIGLENTIWHKVRIKENIPTLTSVSGTFYETDNPVEQCSLLPENIQCFKVKNKEGVVQVISNGGVIPNITGEGIEPMQGEMKSVRCDEGASLVNIHFDGINLQNSDFSICDMRNVVGTFTGDNVQWPSMCDVLKGNIVLCGENLVLNVIIEDLEPDEVTILNEHKVNITSLFQRINVEDVSMRFIHLEDAVLNDIRKAPTVCPQSMPTNWLCWPNKHFLGPYQDLRGQNYSFASRKSVSIEQAYLDQYTVLPRVQIVNTSHVKSDDNLLNPSPLYQVQNNKFIGPGLKVNGTINIDNFEDKDPSFLSAIDLEFASFETNNHFLKTKSNIRRLPIGYRQIPAYENGEWLYYVIGPSLSMPEIWNQQTGICRQNISLSENECDDWLNVETFSSKVQGLRGPLHTCYATGDYTCHNNWLLGPGIDWYGFNYVIEFDAIWFHKPVQNLGTCPGEPYMCIETDVSIYTVLGPNMVINDAEFDLVDKTYSDVSFSNVTISNSVFKNGHIDFSSIEGLTLQNTKFINVSMTTEVCPENREFYDSFLCQGDGLYCHANDVFVEGQVIPTSTNITNACLKGMIILETENTKLHTVSLHNTQLPEDSSQLQFKVSVSGSLGKCPEKVPFGILCHDNRWITGHQTFTNIDVTGVDFTGIRFIPNLRWYNVHGIAKKCPISTPNHWKCIEYKNKKTFKDEAMFIGAGVDFGQYDHFPDDVNVDDISFKDAYFHPYKRFFGLRGYITQCPEVLPQGYTCHYFDPAFDGCSITPPVTSSEDRFLIIGPYTDISDVNMNSICLNESTKLTGIQGQTLICPQLSKDLMRNGYFCGIESLFHIIGPGVSLNGVDFKLFDDIAANMPNVNLEFATIQDKILLRQDERESSCETIENIIGDTCRGKYTDECDNNIPNYICDTSNLHLGTCFGLCGDNITAKYSQTLTKTYRTIKTNSVPNRIYHTDRKADNGNKVCEHYLAIQMIKTPKKSDIFKETCLGPIGILNSGELIYNHMENLQDSFHNHTHTLDTCLGHADSNCFYHIHNISAEINCMNYQPCQQIGYIRDGFPLYSHCSGLKSCYKNSMYEPDNYCHLDEANGYDFTGQGIVDANGSEIEGYAYVVSYDFPHMPIKYAGKQIFDFINIPKFD